jgi:hypothetical protein
LPPSSLRANLTFWHTVPFPARPVELYGKYTAPLYLPNWYLAFDDTMIVSVPAGSVEKTVFTKTFTADNTSNDNFTWRRTELTVPSLETLGSSAGIGMNSKYIAIGMNGQAWNYSLFDHAYMNYTNGAIFFYSRENLTAPPIRINPSRPNQFGSLQMTENTLVLFNSKSNIYKYNETEGAWIESPNVLEVIGYRVQLSGTTIVQSLNSYDKPSHLYNDSFAIYEEDAALTGNFTLTQYINVTSTKPYAHASAHLGGGNLAILSIIPFESQNTLAMYRRLLSAGGIPTWSLQQTINITEPNFSWYREILVSETSMILLKATPTGPVCAPESFMQYFKMNSLTGEWVEEKVNVAFSCEESLVFKRQYGGFALNKNKVALGGRYSIGPVILPPAEDILTNRSPPVVLLFEL